MKRKILTSILALVLCVSMIPMNVLAAEQSGSQTGDVISEGNPAEDIFRVVLPVTTADTYDLTLDPYDLLSTSSLGGDRASYDGSSVYFGIASDPTVTITAGGTLYAATKKASGDVVGFDINNTIKLTDDAVSGVDADELFVWVPQSGQEALGLGEYVALTLANYATYFDVTIDADNDTITDFAYTETAACDGILYAAVGAAVTPAEAVGYCTIADGAVDSLSGLFTEEALTNAADPANLTYTASEVSHTNKATTVTATNKSTYGVVLNVELNATNTTTPVVFTTTANVEGDTELNLALDILGDDASAVSNVVKNEADADGTTNVDFYLSGTTTNYSQYQGATDPDTGGHSYNYLEKVAPTWSDIDFSIQGACNTTADWSAYNATLAADNRLALEVVYTMTAAPDVTATPGDNYNATTGVITLTVPDVQPSTSDQTYSKGAPADVVFTISDLGSGNLAGTTITDIVITTSDASWSINGTDGSNDTLASAFTIDNDADTVTVSSDAFLQYVTSETNPVKIYFDNGTTVFASATLTVTD